MQKVFMILPDLSAGGAERVTITIARILTKDGFDVEFLNLGSPQGEMLEWIVPEFKLTSFGKSRVLSAVPALISFMRKNRDAVYFSSREHVNLVSLISAKIARCHTIVRIPNMPRNKLTKGISGLKLAVIKAINKYLLRSAKVIIAQNDEMNAQLVDFYALPADKVVTVNNPIDTEYILSLADEFMPDFKPDECNFLSVCNIAYSKGIDVLMDAWPKVKAAIPNAHMYVLGRNNTDYAITLQKQAQHLSDFTFLGFKSNPYPYIKACDVFVLPSRMEGFPNVVLEAMCFNKAIASTNCVNVIEQIIHIGENGFFCPIDNPDALAQCMIDASRLSGVTSAYNLFDKSALLACFSKTE